MKIGIIGAGIVGLSITRWLSKYENLEVHVIDKNPDAGWGQKHWSVVFCIVVYFLCFLGLWGVLGKGYGG